MWQLSSIWKEICVFHWYFWLCHFDRVLKIGGQPYFTKQSGILFCTFKIFRPKVCCPLYNIGPCFYHQSHPQLSVVFALPVSSFFLELFLHWSPVAYWASTELGSWSFSVLSFCLFILFMGFSRQEYWSGLPFPSSVDHIRNQIDYILWTQRWKSSIQLAETRPGANCGSDYESLIAKLRLKLKEVGKTTRPFRYDLNQNCPRKP